VRQTIERALEHDSRSDALEQLAGLGAPTGPIDRVLAEIRSGRG
jgi:hypothetical protein